MPTEPAPEQLAAPLQREPHTRVATSIAQAEPLWSHLHWTVLHAEYRTERACKLPEYLGSTFRGGFLYIAACAEPRVIRNLNR